MNASEVIDLLEQTFGEQYYRYMSVAAGKAIYVYVYDDGMVDKIAKLFENNDNIEVIYSGYPEPLSSKAK